MPRPRKDSYDPEPGRRLKILLEEFDIGQATISEVMGYAVDIEHQISPMVNNIVNGRQKARLPEDKAKLALKYINGKIPDKRNHISIEWLMGRTKIDVRTVDDVFHSYFKQWFELYGEDSNAFYDKCVNEIIQSAALKVFSRTPAYLENLQETISQMTEDEVADGVDHAFHTANTFEMRDVIALSSEEFQTLSDKISEYTLFAVQSFIEQKQKRNRQLQELIQMELERRKAIEENRLDDARRIEEQMNAK